MTAKLPTAGVFQNFAPPRKIAAGAHGVGHVHEAIEMNEARHDEGVCAEYRALHKRRERQIPAEPREKRQDRAGLQPDDGQEQKHFIARFLVPHAPKGTGRAETCSGTWPERARYFFKTGSTPLWTMRPPGGKLHDRIAFAREHPGDPGERAAVLLGHGVIAPPASEKI